ncbi:hypothetical protein DSCO28_07740 [Desulfosarcina ovata subsp. sediminis]|uniref:Uncharacterized protein n=1 Tax=Desulfosarcina ovata subsp. sediminis TaxID=885957 RepID=A0A5K7ZDE5_9BACT|nr:hypothetical protein [Desulfosarcina ovata]BBO80208.1 hypothetical protein DSCO28_07740 [Desulfosarcina ovata subsp. sediminis]
MIKSSDVAVDDESKTNAGKWVDAITGKVLGEVSVITVLFGVVMFGGLAFFLTFKQSAALALAAFGIVGCAECLYAKGNTDFRKKSKALNLRQGNDTEAFLKLADKLYGSRGWAAQFEATAVNGVIYRLIESDRAVPLKALAGPVCPRCDKPLNYRPVSWFPWAVCQECLCGFKKTGFTHPKKTYERLRCHFNFPFVDG